MRFGKEICALLIGSQFAVGISMAAPLAAGPSAETLMLQKIIALQAQDIPAEAVQSQVTDTVTQYLMTAPQQGQEARLEQAFVDMHIYTPTQAQAYMSDAEKAAADANSSDAMAAAITQLAETHPSGAEFSISRCDIAPGLLIAGLATVVVGGLTTTIGTCRYSSPDSTTCDLGASYPHIQAGENMMIAGGVVAAVGGLIELLDHKGC